MVRVLSSGLNFLNERAVHRSHVSFDSGCSGMRHLGYSRLPLHPKVANTGGLQITNFLLSIRCLTSPIWWPTVHRALGPSSWRRCHDSLRARSPALRSFDQLYYLTAAHLVRRAIR